MLLWIEKVSVLKILKIKRISILSYQTSVPIFLKKRVLWAGAICIKVGLLEAKLPFPWPAYFPIFFCFCMGIDNTLFFVKEPVNSIWGWLFFNFLWFSGWNVLTFTMLSLFCFHFSWTVEYFLSSCPVWHTRVTLICMLYVHALYSIMASLSLFRLFFSNDVKIEMVHFEQLDWINCWGDEIG